MFSILFAIGLVLIHFGAEAVDLDPSCVLYGALELSPLDTITLGGWQVPRSLPRLLAVLFLNTVVITLFYKELNISSFDPAFARNSGIRTELLNYVFTALIAITTVAVFELVGSILVIAMLVAPAATAFLFCRHLSVMIPVSIGVAVVSAVGGYFLALTVPPLVGLLIRPSLELLRRSPVPYIWAGSVYGECLRGARGRRLPLRQQRRLMSSQFLPVTLELRASVLR